MKNVLQIMDYAAPYRGNFISAIEALEDHWRDGEMIFLFPQVAKNIPWVEEFASTRKVYYIDRLFFSRKVSLPLIKQLSKIVATENISVIHTHFIQANYNLYIFSKFISPRIKYVVNLHNHYIVQGRMGWFKKVVFRNTYDVVIGDSESVSQSAIDIKVSPSKIVTVRNSIQFKRLIDYKLHDFKQGQYDYVTLMFGYPWYRKGVDIVVKALDSLTSQGMRIRLMIARAGGEEDIKKGIIDTLGEMPTWVDFLPPTDNLADYYQSVDVFISSGREEGLSYSPIEAAYCDCSVICSNILGNPLDIPQMPIYDVEDVEALKESLESTLLQTKEELSKNNRIQKQYVSSAYDIDNWAEQIIKTYK